MLDVCPWHEGIDVAGEVAVGHVQFQAATFIAYGDWIIMAGRVLGSFTISFLLWIFVNEGDPEANAFGDPPL